MSRADDRSDPLAGAGSFAGDDVGLELDLSHVGPKRTTERKAETSARDITRREIEHAARFGTAPAGLLGAVPYTVLVFFRRRELSQEVAELKGRVRTAEARATAALFELGQMLCAEPAELGPTMTSALERVARARRTTDVVQQESARAREDAERERARLAAELKDAQADVDPWRDRETKLLTQLKVAEHDLDRARAQLRRAEIEMRNLVKMGNADADQMRMLDGQQDRFAAEVRILEGRVQERTQALTELREELAGRLHRLASAEEAKRGVEAELARHERDVLRTAGEANADLQHALRELAEAALDEGVAAAVAAREARRATEARRDLQRRRRELAVHERALGAYDRQAVKRGAWVFGGVGLFVLAAIIVAAL